MFVDTAIHVSFNVVTKEINNRLHINLQGKEEEISFLHERAIVNTLQSNEKLKETAKEQQTHDTNVNYNISKHYYYYYF